ncbi:MAG: type II toxin-antitoxin system HicB family antitoxin [Acidimicrobiales bacterium]
MNECTEVQVNSIQLLYLTAVVDPDCPSSPVLKSLVKRKLTRARYNQACVPSQRNRIRFRTSRVGGFYVYAPDLHGLHTEGVDIDEAVANGEEALALFVEGSRDDGQEVRR